MPDAPVKSIQANCPTPGAHSNRGSIFHADQHQKQSGPYRTQSEDRRGRFGTGVDIADVQGREDAEGCREGGSQVMTLQRQPTATRSASDRLNVQSSRLLCDDGHSASCPVGAGKSQASCGVDGWTAASLDAGSHMRQEGHERIGTARWGKDQNDISEYSCYCCSAQTFNPSSCSVRGELACLSASNSYAEQQAPAGAELSCSSWSVRPAARRQGHTSRGSRNGVRRTEDDQMPSQLSHPMQIPLD